MIIDEIKSIKSDKSDWRKFGMTMGIILAVMGFYLLWKGRNNSEYAFFLAAAFLIAGMVIPSALKPVYKAWMVMAVIMGFIMTKVIMVVIFYMIVTPIGIIASIIDKDFLDMKIDKKAKSYWMVRETVRKEKSDYEKQF
ncbi:MAG TPA: SxtJ family membrane protein [Smithella sp.]|nr:SxtJ family membrane protein [Smithella sp.]